MEISSQSKLFKKIFDEAFKNVKKKYTLTTNEILFLLQLDRNERNNSASEIVDELMITKSHLSKSIDSLYKRGYIEKMIDEIDKKIVRLFISSNCDELMIELKRIEKEMYKKIVAGINKDDLIVFERVLKQIQNNFENFYKK